MSQTGTQGALAEDKAARHLIDQGLQLVERNYHCRHGELDLIMMHGEYLVFVEVRHRHSDSHGGALASIDFHKQRKLRRAAQHYLQRHKKNDSPCRFDILCLDGPINSASINWISNAF